LAFRYLVRYTDCLFCGHWTAVAWSGNFGCPLDPVSHSTPLRGGWPILVYRWIVFAWIISTCHMSSMLVHLRACNVTRNATANSTIAKTISIFQDDGLIAEQREQVLRYRKSNTSQD
jgi:hypothetical protein